MDGGGGQNMYQFQQTLESLKCKIRKWNKEEFGNIFVDKINLEGRLEGIQR